MKKPSKILIVRTDRLGDVVLSTPVIECVRKWAPSSHIAFMCTPYTKDIVEGNPMLDEVIIYDKYGKHRGWLSTIRFIGILRRKKFDMALILHATNRAHIICRFAGIAKRVGWNRKKGYLLTDKVYYCKKDGKRHEMDYNFDILKAAGIPVVSRRINMTVPDKVQFTIKKKLIEIGFTEGFIAVHPGGRSVSQRWPVKKFAALIEKIHKELRIPIVIIGGEEEKERSRFLGCVSGSFVRDLTGKLSIKELAAILRESLLLVSNDSGPVHIACALRTPVIDIFGRKMPGLGPVAWGPVGERCKVIFHDIGCNVCFTDDCEKNFACLEAVTVDEVFKEVKTILKIKR